MGSGWIYIGIVASIALLILYAASAAVQTAKKNERYAQMRGIKPEMTLYKVVNMRPIKIEAYEKIPTAEWENDLFKSMIFDNLLRRIAAEMKPAVNIRVQYDPINDMKTVTASVYVCRRDE